MGDESDEKPPEAEGLKKLAVADPTNGNGNGKGRVRDDKGRFLPGVIPPAGVMFAPGVSGNPGGYSGGRRMANILLRQLERINLDDPEQRTFAELLMERLIRIGLQTKSFTAAIQAINSVLERTDGKVALPLKVEQTMNFAAFVRFEVVPSPGYTPIVKKEPPPPDDDGAEDL